MMQDACTKLENDANIEQALNQATEHLKILSVLAKIKPPLDFKLLMEEKNDRLAIIQDIVSDNNVYSLAKFASKYDASGCRSHTC
jgi:hypothetical protein